MLVNRNLPPPESPPLWLRAEGQLKSQVVLLPAATKSYYTPVKASTGLTPGSSSLALSWAGSTGNSGLLFKARMNGGYANGRLPRSEEGRGGLVAGRPAALHSACHMKGFVLLLLAPVPSQARAVLTRKQKSLSDQSKTRPQLAREGHWTLFTLTQGEHPLLDSHFSPTEKNPPSFQRELEASVAIEKSTI